MSAYKGTELTRTEVESLLDSACKEVGLTRAQARLKIQREGTTTLRHLHIQKSVCAARRGAEEKGQAMTAEIEAMRQDVAHSRKQKFFYGRLVMKGRPTMKRMESRLLAFLNKQTDPRKRNPYITR